MTKTLTLTSIRAVKREVYTSYSIKMLLRDLRGLTLKKTGLYSIKKKKF